MVGQNEGRHRLANLWRICTGLDLIQALGELVDSLGVPRLVRTRGVRDDAQAIIQR